MNDKIIRPKCNIAQPSEYKAFFHFMSLDKITEEKLKTIEEGCVWSGDPNFFNDPFECIIGYDEKGHLMNYANEVRSSALHRGILCLNATKKESFDFMSKESILMWAYYGGANTGICIEYSPDIIKRQPDEQGLLEVDEVSYRKEPHTLNESDYPEKSEDRSSILSIKNKIWEHEHEVRFVYKTYGKKKFLKESIKAIYCGCRIKPEHMIRVKKLCDRLKVPCYILKPKLECFCFDIYQVELKEILKFPPIR